MFKSPLWGDLGGKKGAREDVLNHLSFLFYLYTFIFYLSIMERTEKILVLYNEFEAKLLGEILTVKNIPYVIKSYHDSAYDGLWQSQFGWGHLEAPEKYKAEILKVYSEMNPGNSVDGSKNN